MIENDQNVKIINCKIINDYLFIELENGQRILTDGNKLYDVLNYSYVFDIFNMENRLCAVMRNRYSYTIHVVDLETMEILFYDDRAYRLNKEDDRMLLVSFVDDDEKMSVYNTIYDIKIKKYLPSLKNYEFEKSLENNLYVFRENYNSETNFYDRKRCILNVDGKVVLNDIEGSVETHDSFVIIENDKELCIIKNNEDYLLDINTIKQDENLIAKPVYNDGNIILMEKGLIKIFSLDLNLINQFEIKELESIIDYEIVSNILKLCLPYNIDGKQINKHLFINLKTGKTLSHVRIEGYPYWTPNIFVGKDHLEDELLTIFKDETYEPTYYKLYDKNFNKIAEIKGNFYENINDNIFLFNTWDGKNLKRKYVNIDRKSIKDCDYDVVKFALDNMYGYAFNNTTDMIDIVDKNLKVIIPNIDYKKLGISKSDDFLHDFSYFVVNDYVCIIKRIADGPYSYFREIIQNTDGEIVLDSMHHKCYPIGDLIQINKNGKSEFLNTLTGEIGQLSVIAPTDMNGNIIFDKIKNLMDVFRVENESQSKVLCPEKKRLKVKKMFKKN